MGSDFFENNLWHLRQIADRLDEEAAVLGERAERLEELSGGIRTSADRLKRYRAPEEVSA